MFAIAYEFWLPQFILDWAQIIACLLVVGGTIAGAAFTAKWYLSRPKA